MYRLLYITYLNVREPKNINQNIFHQMSNSILFKSHYILKIKDHTGPSANSNGITLRNDKNKEDAKLGTVFIKI